MVEMTRFRVVILKEDIPELLVLKADTLALHPQLKVDTQGPHHLKVVIQVPRPQDKVDILEPHPQLMVDILEPHLQPKVDTQEPHHQTKVDILEASQQLRLKFSNGLML